MANRALCVAAACACVVLGGCGSSNKSVSASPRGLKVPDPAELARRPQALVLTPKATGVALPTAVDLRPTAARQTSALVSAVPVPQDQGKLGSCSSWAMCFCGASAVQQKLRQWGLTTADHQASPAFAYDRVLTMEHGAWGDGTDMRNYGKLLVDVGCSSLALVPYSDTVRASGASAADAGNFRITSWKALDGTNRMLLKAELAKGNVVPFSAYLPSDFDAFKGGKVYVGASSYMMDGSKKMGHAMALVGYDDAQGAFIVQNSNGPYWADNGYVRWDYADLDKHLTGEAFVLDGVAGQPNPNPTETVGIKVSHAAQVADTTFAGQDVVYLVFDVDLDDPVTIVDAKVTDPQGNVAVQDYDELEFDTGQIYWTRSDGQSWLPGTYTLTLDIVELDGETRQISATADVTALASRVVRFAAITPAWALGLPAAGVTAAVCGENGARCRWR